MFEAQNTIQRQRNEKRPENTSRRQRNKKKQKKGFKDKERRIAS